MDARGYRFRQGTGPVVDANGLVDAIRTDQPVTVVEPETKTLAWSPELARRWACDCVEHVLPAAGNEDVSPLTFAINAARQHTVGEVTTGMLDGVFTELVVEEWPTYKGPFFQLVKAARQMTARDENAGSFAATGIVTPGEWAASAAREARGAVADQDGERRWQVERLLHHLLGA